MTTAVHATASMFKEAAAMVAAIHKSGSANARHLAEMKPRLEHACTNKEPSSLVLYLKALPKLVDDIESTLEEIVPFQRLMAEIEEDEAFVQDHLSALGKLTTTVEDLRFQATLQIKLCKEMKVQATYVLAQHGQSVDRAERLLASHEKWLNDTRKEIAAAVARSASLVATAEKAAAKPDRKGFAAAQKAFDALAVDDLVAYADKLDRLIAQTLQTMSVVAADKGRGSEIAAEIKASVSTKQDLAPALGKLAAAKKRFDALAKEMKAKA
jgi:hypothetical protein